MPSDILSTYLTPVALALMMTGMGLSLTLGDFSHLLKNPKALVVGLLAQMLGLPLLGLLIASIFALSAWQSAGIMLLVSCAGGVVSGLLTQMIKGDTALSITMTAISMLLGLITIPIVINASLGHFLQQNQYITLDLLETSLRLLAMTVLPVVTGMVLRYQAPTLAMRFKAEISHISNLLLLLIILLTMYQYSAEILQASLVLWLPLFLLNALAMLLGYTCARLARLDNKVANTLVIEVGIQNSATGIFIATILLNNTLLALPAIIYTGIAFVNFTLFMFILRSPHGYAKPI